MGRRGFPSFRTALPLARIARAMAIACALVSSLGATTVNAATVASATTQAVIITKLSLVKTADLDFGNMVTPTANETLTLDPQVTPICTPSGTLVHFGACQPAEFYGYGESGYLININRPNVPITITNTNPLYPGTTMDITAVTLDGDPNLTYVSGNMSANGVVRYRIASASGVFSFRIGGTLNVNAGQSPGLYQGSFDVSVKYQ